MSDKIQEVYENTILSELTKEKFTKHIKAATGNRNRLSNLKKTIQGMSGHGLSKEDVASLVSSINSKL